MADYIDRDELLKVITENSYMLCDISNSKDKGMFLCGIEQAINEMPSVDAVEVVRCKDCKYKIPIFNTFQCTKLHKEFSDYDFFCKWGEKG